MDRGVEMGWGEKIGWGVVRRDGIGEWRWDRGVDIIIISQFLYSTYSCR